MVVGALEREGATAALVPAEDDRQLARRAGAKSGRGDSLELCRCARRLSIENICSVDAVPRGQSDDKAAAINREVFRGRDSDSCLRSCDADYTAVNAYGWGYIRVRCRESDERGLAVRWGTGSHVGCLTLFPEPHSKSRAADLGVRILEILERELEVRRVT